MALRTSFLYALEPCLVHVCSRSDRCPKFVVSCPRLNRKWNYLRGKDLKPVAELSQRGAQLILGNTVSLCRYHNELAIHVSQPVHQL